MDGVKTKYRALIRGVVYLRRCVRACMQGYGMTEAGPVLSMCLAFAKEPFRVKSGACGTVVRNAELKIVDPDTGRSLARNLPGEICIRGQQIMKGKVLVYIYTL